MRPEKRIFWTRMFATHQAALTGFFRRRVAHPWDAQDLAQEVHVRLLRIDGREDSVIANPEACLFTVASNLVKEHAVLQKRHGLGVDIAQLLPELQAPQGSAEDEAERDFHRQRLTAMLDRPCGRSARRNANPAKASQYDIWRRLRSASLNPDVHEQLEVGAEEATWHPSTRCCLSARWGKRPVARL